MNDRTDSQLRIVEAGPDSPQPVRLSALVWLLAGCVAAFIVYSSVARPGPSWLLVAILVSLAVCASHRERFYQDETAISASLVVIVASIVVFRSAPLGPVLCAAAAGVHWSHLRGRSWAKAMVNVGSTSLPAGIAAVAYGSLSTSEFSTTTPMTIVVVVVVYWVLNNLLIAAALTFASSERFTELSTELIKSETEMLVFAFAGGLCGLVMLEVSTWIGLVALVVVLIAADLLVISRPHPATVRMRHPGLGAAVTQIGSLSLAAGGSFVLADLVGPFAAAGIGAIAGSLLTFIVILGFYRRRMDAWHPRIAIGVVWADAPATAISAIVGSVAASVSLVIGAGVAAGAGAAAIAVAQWRRRRCAAADEDDAIALALVELALLDRPKGSTPAS